ncbi:MAG: Xylose isomerase protein barrel [Acidimicrobiia bacterium]|nr:Xylose isomerase protein barrel [Acidimicrobiia bacterium]
MEWVLWAGTIGFDTTMEQRFAVAAQEGFQYVSLAAWDVAREAEQGCPPAELRRRAAGHGVGLIMDPITGWHPTVRPTTWGLARYSMAEILTMSEALGIRSISAIAGSSRDFNPEAMIPAFAALCDAAAQFGAQVHLEFMPMSAVPDLATAWRIVQGAGRPNGGLTFDTWHFFRGDADFALLESIPGDRIFAVQIDDAAAEVHGSLWDDTMHRLLPGDGVFPLTRVVDVLKRIGALRLLGPEVISPTLAALPAAEAGRLARQRVEALL